MSAVLNRLYAARSPEGVELWIPESEMPSDITQAQVLAILSALDAGGKSSFAASMAAAGGMLANGSVPFAGADRYDFTSPTTVDIHAYGTVDGDKYSYGGIVFGLHNPAAGEPFEQLGGIYAEGNYADDGTVTNNRIAIYNYALAVDAFSIDFLNNSATFASTVAATGFKVGATAGIDFSGAVTNITVVKGIVTAAS